MKERFLIYLILALNIITLIILLSKSKTIKKEEYCGCGNMCNQQLDKAYMSDYNPETTMDIGGIYYSTTS